jgi:hypothetical protein
MISLEQISEIKALNKTLRQRLEESDGDAIEIVESIQLLVQQTPFQPALSMIEDQVNAFDFDSALDLLADFESQIESTNIA